MSNKRCEVYGCKNEAEYYNPRSKMKYCKLHRDKLEGHIIYDSKNRDIEPLKKIPIGGIK